MYTYTACETSSLGIYCAWNALFGDACHFVNCFVESVFANISLQGSPFPPSILILFKNMLGGALGCFPTNGAPTANPGLVFHGASSCFRVFPLILFFGPCTCASGFASVEPHAFRFRAARVDSLQAISASRGPQGVGADSTKIPKDGFPPKIKT